MQVIWIDPAAIEFKISPVLDLRGVEGGDWDLTRRVPLDRTAKYRAVVQRFGEGARWEDTDLFRDAYARRLGGGDAIRGKRTIEDVAAAYYAEVDPIFASMKRDGFRQTKGLPRLLLGRDGSVFIGNQGNHRLAMAHVLKLERFAGEVICRHPEAP